MRLQFDADDHAPFERTRDALLDDFGRWLTDRPDPLGGSDGPADPQEARSDAALALDWKWGYGDGDLGRWRLADAGEFLLEWCPRKLSLASPEDAVSVPSSLALFVEFLSDRELLAAGSARVGEFRRACVEVAPAYLAAMAEPSNWGLAKSLFGAAASDGVDLTDTAAVNGWMESFNARPENERRAILPSAPTGPSRVARRALPPVVAPAEAERLASEAAAPVAATFAALAGYVGAGRKLTATGNFTLADARALVPLLGTGDVIDERIGDRVYKTQSAADLLTLCFVFRWARQAGIVRVEHNKVIATRAGLALTRGRPADYDRIVDALLTVGPLTGQRPKDQRYFARPEVDAFLDEGVPEILTALYGAPVPVTVDDLNDLAGDAVLAGFRFTRTSDEDVRGFVGWDVDKILEALVLSGLVRADAPDPAPIGDGDPYSRVPRFPAETTVALTPAGVATTRRLLGTLGFDAPEPRFAGATAAELLAGTDDGPFTDFAAEFAAWREGRSDADAVAGLADAAATLDDAPLCLMALELMGQFDVSLGEPYVRSLAGGPGPASSVTVGLARCWLVDHGFETAGILYDPDDTDGFVDVLAARLVSGAAAAVVETLALAGDAGAQGALLGRLWRCPSPATLAVLDALAGAHPDKALAKAARKSLYQHRSHYPGRG